MEGHTPFSQEIELESGREVVVTANLPEEGRLWTWITLGTGLAIVGGGVWLGLVAQDKLDEADSVEGKRLQQDEFDTLRDEGETAALGSILLYGLGAATIAASVVIFFLEGPADRPAPAREQTTVRFLLGPGFTGVVGTF